MMLHEKLHKIMAAQKSALIERDSEIEGVWLVLLSGEHGFFYGPPGVAKSLITADTARYFPEAAYFYHLMGKHTVPEELFGPISITALKQDKFEFKTEGYLPNATFAFLDEGFKANGAILNALLMIMNERLFRNGTHVNKIPLQSMFIASNEIPTEPELGAMYDRILFRFNVQDLQRSEDFLRLLSHEDKITDFLKGDPVETFSMAELQQLRASVDRVVVPEDVLKGIVDIRDTLAMEHQITASSRRWLRTLKGVRAHAVMHGRDTAEFRDLVPLIYMLWQHVDQIPTLKQIVWNVANPTLFVLQSLRDDISMLYKDMNEAMNKGQSHDHDRIAVEYDAKINEVQGRVALALAELSVDDRKKYEDKFSYMIKVLKGFKTEMLTRIGGIDPKAVAPGAITRWEPEKI